MSQISLAQFSSKYHVTSDENDKSESCPQLWPDLHTSLLSIWYDLLTCRRSIPWRKTVPPKKPKKNKQEGTVVCNKICKLRLPLETRRKPVLNKRNPLKRRRNKRKRYSYTAVLLSLILASSLVIYLTTEMGRQGNCFRHFIKVKINLKCLWTVSRVVLTAANCLM